MTLSLTYNTAVPAILAKRRLYHLVHGPTPVNKVADEAKADKHTSQLDVAQHNYTLPQTQKSAYRTDLRLLSAHTHPLRQRFASWGG
jgi:hypothetical protein